MFIFLTGQDTKTATVGDPLSLIFEILDPESPYEIFVRDLIALDGATDAELTLIDDRGCPADPTIMSELKKSPASDKILVSRFDAFRFPRYSYCIFYSQEKVSTRLVTVAIQ